MSTERQIRERITLGFWLYILSDCVLFAALFATYAVLRAQTFGAPGIGDIVNVPYALLETALLLTSSFAMGLSLIAAGAGKRRLALWGLLATLALGLGFLGLEMGEFSRLVAEGSGPGRSAFLSSFFALLGAHGLHVLLGSVWMAVLMAHVALRGLTEGTMRKLACLALFWHFLDIIWIFIFTLVYLFGTL